MRVNSAILCDFAEVREQLLFVVAGGVTRLNRPAWPGAMNTCLAIVLELDRNERDRLHELDVQIIDADGVLIARIQGAFQQTAGPEIDIHEITFFPFTFDLRQVGIPHVGWYSIGISIDGEAAQTVRFRAVVVPAPPAGA